MLSRVLAGVVGVVFALAGASKIVDWAAWRSSARAQHVWPIVAVAIPPLELVLGAWLVVFEPSPVSLGLATCLLLVFTAFLAVQIRMGSAVPCACFGMRSTRAPGARDVRRNLALLAALVVAAASA